MVVIRIWGLRGVVVVNTVAAREFVVWISAWAFMCGVWMFFLCMLCGPMMDWRPVQDVPRLLPNGSWDRLQRYGLTSCLACQR